jgi:hypothetical protein
MNRERHLLLRRMGLARRACARAHQPGQPKRKSRRTAQYGFRQFGRVAGEYKSLFGELPSATLSQPRE